MCIYPYVHIYMYIYICVYIYPDICTAVVAFGGDMVVANVHAKEPKSVPAAEYVPSPTAQHTSNGNRKPCV